MEDQIFSDPSACQSGDLVFDLLFGHQVMLILIHLHGIAKGSAGTGDDGDLGDRCGIGLHSGHQSMADLMVGNDLFFFFRQDRVLLLISGDNDFDGFFQIGLGHELTSVTDRAEGCFVDHVGKLGTGSTDSHTGDRTEINIVSHTNFAGMYFQNIDTSLQIGQLDRDAAVKTAGTQKGRVQRIGTVGGSQDDNTFVGVKAIHLSQQLVQCLLPLVVAADAVDTVTFFTDGIDLIDEDDAGCLFIGLLEQIADLGSAHAHEHFNELGTRDREEGDVGLAGYRLGKQGFTGSRRAYQQRAFGNGSADSGIALRIVKIIDNFTQQFFSFFLAGYIRKADAVGGLYIDAGVGLAEGHGIPAPEGVAAHPLHQRIHEQTAQQDKNHQGQYPAYDKLNDRIGLFLDLGGEIGDAGLLQAVDQVGIVHLARFIIIWRIGFILEKDLVFGHLDFRDVAVADVLQELTVTDFGILRLIQTRDQQEIDQDHDRQNDQ